MKVILLLADCNTSYLTKSVETVIKVLEELDIEIHKVDLYKLPYFTGIKTKEMESVMSAIRESKGVIAVTNVPMLSIHGAMQSFFDAATLYTAENFNKQVPLEEIEVRLEKEVEDFYRLLKQERGNIGCSERMIYRFIKEGVNLNEVASYKGQSESKVDRQPEIKSFASMLRAEGLEKTKEPEARGLEVPKSVGVEKTAQKESYIDLSTKEQTIKEISSLLKKEVNDEFISMNTGVYRRPGQGEIVKNKKIQQLPHYFIAQHDKSLKATLKYQITDIGEEGYIIIENGDCVYEEVISGMPTVELVLTDDVFREIQSKKMTYQKAFMLGKLKVKGNFAILPKLDQVFKSS